MKRRAPWILTAAFISAATVVLASNEATLTGKVTDAAGQPLPGATVTLRNHDLGATELGRVTDVNGDFRFPLLPPGLRYELTVSMPGYGTIIFSDFQLEAGRTVAQTVMLRPSGEMQEVVRVKGKSETLETEKVTASTTFSATFIAELPLLHRDYQDILVLAPGVTDVNGTGNPNIHGARDTDVVTLVDGVSTTDPFTGYFGQNLNIESIQELEVITSAATAQYSRAQGGFANILTKSGGNEFKGSFKMFLRSDKLDGDGAGIEDPELTGGLQGGRAYTEQHFTDIMPFLSLSGAIVRDKLWYYLALEYIHEETPVNALTQAFVTPVYGHREFFKTTWQMQPGHRLAFSVLLDEERNENLGISSLTDTESGYSSERGGPTLTLRASSVFSPTLLLESSLSWFANQFSETPTISPDTNGNGILFTDDRPELGGDGDGLFDATERDPGEDWDFNESFYVFEDLNHDGLLEAGEDKDRDGYLNSRPIGCEGYQHEDLNCSGGLDAERDANINGRPDPEEDLGIPCDPRMAYCADGVIPGTRGNGRFDTEDANGNGTLDVVGDSGYTAFPFWVDANANGEPDPGEYEAPLPPDQDLQTDLDGRTFGPSPFSFEDSRTRLSWLEDLSVYVGELWGTHDLKIGGAIEREGYDSDTFRRPNIFYPTRGAPAPVQNAQGPASGSRYYDQASAVLGIPAFVNNTADGDNLGLYFQDNWKPVPNLTLNLGLRFDYENLSSFGYSHFDPAAERRAYNGLMEASGLDMNHIDTVVSQGLCMDPLRSCDPGADLHGATITNRLRTAAFSRLTRHNLDVDILAAFLAGTTGGTIDLSEVLGYAVPTRHPEEFRITNSNLAPRLSVSWDPWGDGKTMLFGSWGRYYDKLFLGSLVLEQGPDTVVRSYAFDGDGVDDRGLPNNRLGAPVEQSSLSAFQVDRDLSTPHSDEWTAGFRRELAPEVSVSLRYVHRDYHDQLQDIDVNHRAEIDPVSGQFADRIGNPDCQPADGCKNISDGAPDLYVENFYMNRVYRLGNYNEQTYRGWELEIVRRLKRKWQLEASYTYSEARGDAESFRSILGNDAALTEYEPGFLDYDQRHVVKLNAIAFLPGDWRLGGTATWASGLPYSYVSHYNAIDDVGFSQNRLLFGQLGASGYGFTPEARNLHRNPATYLFNARIMKSFVLGKAASSAFLEVYNLLNTDNLRVHSVEQVPARVAYRTFTGGHVLYPPSVYLVGERDFGRRFQVGMQIDF